MLADMSAENRSGLVVDGAVSSGIELDERDHAVREQDDLFRHMNGKWIDRTPVPDDKARYGPFCILADEAEAAVRKIVDDARSAPEGTEQRSFGDLYSSFIDEERVERLGLSPIRDDLRRVRDVQSVGDFLATIAPLEKDGASGFLRLFVDNDPGNPERYCVFVEQGGLGLPDESYYRDENFATLREAYRAHVTRVFERAGERNPADRATLAIGLEVDIATLHWNNVRCRDSVATYNPTSWSDTVSAVARESRGAANLDVWLGALGVPSGSFETVVIRQPSFVSGLGGLLTDDRLESWKAWLEWSIIRSAAPYLSSEFAEANFDFYGRQLTGARELRARWKRAVAFVEGAMGEAVGKVYVERHFPPDAKIKMDILVRNLITAYRDSIADNEWMGSETRARALDKLSSFAPKIGYPTAWRDYSALTSDPADLMGNVRRSARFEFDRQLAKIGAPLDRDEWFMTPQTINAYYNSGFNEIVFPAAILQKPFFDPLRDDAANYGAIGAVIGHEIGHGFDDQGSKYDGAGRLADWWTASDRAAFDERTRALVAQFNELAPAQIPTQHVNGELTIGENIGDLGGLSIAWKAYLISLEGQKPRVVDGLSGAQRFFLSWAQSWRQKVRNEEAIRLLTDDPHSPNEFRCNQIVRNIEQYYESFGVKESDALWLNPSERVTIW